MVAGHRCTGLLYAEPASVPAWGALDSIGELPMDTERRERGEQAVLLAELQHRVRSTLGTMRALVRRSAETNESLDAYVMHLDARLDAMARVQNAFVRNPTGGIDLGLMVADELAACRAREGETVSIEGPPIKLHPRAAEPFGLALHELAINALKFGALTQPSGRIAVTWHVEEREGGRCMLFEWIETGVRARDTGALRYGFGRIVLEEMLPHNLRARARFALTPEGLVYSLDLPLTDKIVRAG